MRTFASIAAPLESAPSVMARYAASARAVSPAATQARPASDNPCARKNGNRAASAARWFVVSGIHSEAGLLESGARGTLCRASRPEIPHEQHRAQTEGDPEVAGRLSVPLYPLDESRQPA